MDILTLILAALVAALGINIVADSYPTRRRLMLPHCHACLAPRDPLSYFGLSAWLLGRWRCQYCGRPRQVRLIVVELLSLAGALFIYLSQTSLLELAPSFLVYCLFLLISVIDIEHRLIPHAISLPSILVVGLLAALEPARGVARTALGGLAGFGIVLVLYLLGELYSRWQARRRGQPIGEVAFGFGDVTLSTLIGVAVGWPAIILALMIGVLSAGAFSLAAILWMLVRGKYQPHMPIPYGPFLILGGSLVFFGGQQLFQSLLMN
jgi:leader peptidase (prepilin peptidase)/N-methyltransferase